MEKYDPKIKPFGGIYIMYHRSSRSTFRHIYMYFFSSFIARRVSYRRIFSVHVYTYVCDRARTREIEREKEKRIKTKKAIKELILFKYFSLHYYLVGRRLSRVRFPSDCNRRYPKTRRGTTSNGVQVWFYIGIRYLTASL